MQPIHSVLSSAALGEALLYLATTSTVQITDRRVILVRELSRLEVRYAAGIDERRGRLPDQMLAGEKLTILNELRRAAAFGTTAAMQRYRMNGVPHAASGALSGRTRPAA